MPRCMILYPNRADPPVGPLSGASLSGGGWTDQLPLGNLQKQMSSRIARSVDTDPQNTQFDVTMTAQNQIRAVVLVRHNLSVTASWRITAWYDGEDPTFDRTEDVYPSLGFTEDIPWEADNWWDGKPQTEEIFGYAQNAIMVLDEYVAAPNWRIEIFDENNADGYVQAGRLFMAGGWQPSFNYSYGGAHGLETDTAVEKSRGGQEYFDVRDPARVAQVEFQYLPQDEALLQGLSLARRAGVHSEVFWIANPANRRTLTQTSFLARIRSLPAWRQSVYARADLAYEFKELL